MKDNVKYFCIKSIIQYIINNYLFSDLQKSSKKGIKDVGCEKNNKKHSKRNKTTEINKIVFIRLGQLIDHYKKNIFKYILYFNNKNTIISLLHF